MWCTYCCIERYVNWKRLCQAWIQPRQEQILSEGSAGGRLSLPQREVLSYLVAGGAGWWWVPVRWVTKGDWGTRLIYEWEEAWMYHWMDQMKCVVARESELNVSLAETHWVIITSVPSVDKLNNSNEDILNVKVERSCAGRATASPCGCGCRSWLWSVGKDGDTSSTVADAELRELCFCYGGLVISVYTDGLFSLEQRDEDSIAV